MSRNPLFSVAVVVVCAGAASALVPRGVAAPIPKDAGKVDPTPDLKAFLAAVGRAVEKGKWPAAAEEKQLRETVKGVFEGAVKAANQKDRKLPVDFDKLLRADVAARYDAPEVEGAFVIAGDVRLTSARNSVVFATGKVHITRATGCVIVAREVRCTGAPDCVIVASEYVRVDAAKKRTEGSGPMLVAGHWVRASVLEDAVCHVLKPAHAPPPDELQRNPPHTAVRTRKATRVNFLNAAEDTRANGPESCTYSPPKTPIAK